MLFLLDRYYDRFRADSFQSAIQDMASDLQCNPQHLVMVMYFESKLNPRACSDFGTATGLIQIIKGDLKKIGTTMERFREMSGEQQLPFILEYLRPFAGGMNTLVDTYFAAYFPVALDQGDEFKFRFPRKFTQANKTFPLREGNRVLRWEVELALCKYFLALGWKTAG